MTPAMLRDTLRTMGRTMGRFLSIFAIVALGVGFFAGVRATGSDMRITADRYYDDTRTADVRLLSTMGFSDRDVAAVRAIPGVSGVMPSRFVDVLTLSADNFATRVHSLPSRDPASPDNQNQLRLLEGRLPQAPDECLIDSAVAGREGFTLGRVITFAPGGTKDDLGDWLSRRSYTIVGVAESPLYIDSTKRGNTSIGNGTLKAFVYIPEENFVPDDYTDLYLTWGPALPLAAYTPEYDGEVGRLLEALEELEATRAPARLAEVRAEAQEKIDDAREELADGRREMEEQLAEAEKTIAEAEQKLLDGEEDYRRGLLEYEEETGKAQGELDEAKAELDDGWAQYREGRDALRSGERELRESLPQLQAAEARFLELQKGVAALLAGLEAFDVPPDLPGIPLSSLTPDQMERLDLLRSGLNRLTGPQGESLGLGELLTETAFFPLVDEGGSPVLDPDTGAPVQVPMEAVTPGSLAAVRAALGQYESESGELVARARREYDDGVESIQEARRDLNDARRELEKGRDKYQEGLAEFEEKKAEAQKELDDAQRQIADGRAELADGRLEYQEKKAEAEAEIAEAEGKLADAQRELADLKLPQWFIQDRYDAFTAYGSYRDDANRIDNVAAIFPVFFLGVAALVCLTTMTRMVEEERGQIGTAKALGYTSRAIAAKYLLYAVSASLLGSLAGLLVGFWLFPTVIYNAYRILYDMPDISAPFWWGTGLLSCLAAVLVSALVTASACWGELRASPAEIMRPKAPKAGKRVLLERLPFLWRRLGFIQKVTVRNLFRYKKRVLMTVVGIAGCTALMLAGFGLNDAIGDIVRNQYGDIVGYDMMVLYQNDGSPRDLVALDRLTQPGDTGVAASADQYLQSMTAVSQTGDKTLDVNLTVAAKPEELGDFITLRTRLGHEPLSIPPDGAVVTEKLAQLFGLSVGDELVVQDPDGVPRSLRVAGVTENYASHFVYLGPEYYREVFGSQPEYNSRLLKLLDVSLENSVSRAILENKSVLAVTLTSTIRSQFGSISDSFRYVIAVLVLSAGLLAVVVLLNLTNINITERVREIATLKVLGFYDREVSAYIYRENTALTLLGTAAGLLLGVALTRFVVVTAEIDAIMFGRDIYPKSYAVAAVLTLLFSAVVNLVMYFRLRRVDMVESMKSVD